MSMDPFEFCEPVNKPRSRTPKNNKHRVAASRYPPVKMQHQQARANRPSNLALANAPAPTPVGLPRAMDNDDDDDDTTQDDSDIIHTGRISAKRRLFVSNPDDQEQPILWVSSEHEPIDFQFKLENERIAALRIPHNNAVIYFVSSDPRLQPAPGNDARLYSATMAAFMRLQLNQESHSLFNSPPFGITDITCLVTVRCGMSHVFTPFILTAETTLHDLRQQTPFGDHDVRVYRNGEPVDITGMSKTLVDCGIRAGDDVLVVMDCNFTFF